MDLRAALQRALGTPYTLERELEGGGMARVFVAHDAALGRDIVVKLLRPEIATSVSVGRFEREVRLVARLQHPHIVPLLSAGDVDGLPFYTMPFVRGESLRARLTRAGALPVGEAIRILRDIAAALACAHAQGVVHRDIKPENVLLSGGVAVVTDFGVAKAMAASRRESGAGDAEPPVPTRSRRPAARSLLTHSLELGTPAYMSPEQARADPRMDHRADLYAFGCVAYEMLCGAPPCAGRAAPGTLPAHGDEPPEPLVRRRPDVPDALAALVTRCLARRPCDRPPSAEEMLAALDTVATPSRGAEATRARPARWRARRGLTLGGLGAAALGLGALALRAGGRPAASFTVQSTRLVSAAPELEVDPALSPDGGRVAYASGPLGAMRIYVRPLGGGPAVPLSGTRAPDGDDRWPAWSPDGSRILFVAMRHLSGGRAAMYVVPSVGGVPRQVVEGTGTRAVTTPAWSPDGRWIVYSDGRRILLQPAAGGAPSVVAEGAEVHSPAFSPDGGRLAYVDGNRAFHDQLNIAASSIWTVALPAGGRPAAPPVRLTDSTHQNLSPVWAPDGRSLLFVSDLAGERDVYQQRLSRDGGPSGPPGRLTTGLGASALTLSRDGERAVCAVLRLRSRVWLAPISPRGATPASAIRPVTREAEAIEGLDVSRDGRWLAYDSNRSGNQDVYKVPVDGGEPVQLTRDPAPDFMPQWSLDGRAIAYYAMRDGHRHVRVMSAEGRDDRGVTSGPTEDQYPTWSPDGRELAFVSRPSTQANGEVFVVARDPRGGWSGRRQITHDSLAGGPFARWSPDGASIAYRRWASPDRGWVLMLADPAGRSSQALLTSRELGGESIHFAAWGPDPGVIYVHTMKAGEPGSVHSSFWAMSLAGRAPRLLLRLDDPARRPRREEFATDGRRLFFTLAADESDLWTMELKR